MTSQYLPPDAQAKTVAAPVELLPCPFCGGPAKMIDPMGDFVGKGLGVNGGYYGPRKRRVVCGALYETPIRNCPSRGAYDTEAQAIAAWNTRTPDPLLVQALELARDIEYGFATNRVGIPFRLRRRLRAILAQAKERGL